MSNLRKCTNCKDMIKLNTEDYFTEEAGRNIYRHKECGKGLLDLPAAAFIYHGITLQIHFGSNCPFKSFLIKGLLVVNADFPADLETERIPIGKVLAYVNWSNTTSGERKEIESKFISTFGGVL